MKTPMTACVFGLILGACAVRPAASPPSVPVASVRTWSDPTLLATLKALGGDTPAAPDTLSSSEALAAALTYNPELALQRAQSDIARAELAQARERRNPILNFGPEHLISTAARGVSPWVVAISLVWPLRTAGKRDLEIEQALATSDASLLEAANAIWSLRNSTRGAVCSLEIAAQRSELASEDHALRADLAARLEKQAAAGLVSRYEAARSAIDRDQAQHRSREAQAALESARFDLADITGLTRAALDARKIGDTCAGGMPELAALPELQGEAIAARLDLRAKLAEFRAADAALRDELAKRYPDFDVGPGYLYDQGDRKITLSLAAELPVFSHNDARIARTAAARTRAGIEVEKLQWSIGTAVERANTLLALRRQQFADAERIVAESQALVDRDRARFESGELDQPAVIVTRLEALSARQDALAAKQTLLDALAALEVALQRPLAAPYFDGAAAAALLSPPEQKGSPR
jgi:cobalt-zinc-cadmium efflux system outer membrane protein